MGVFGPVKAEDAILIDLEMTIKIKTKRSQVKYQRVLQRGRDNEGISVPVIKGLKCFIKLYNLILPGHRYNTV